MTAVPEHPCSDCGRTAPRVKRLTDGGGLCRRCYNLRRREECSRCRQYRVPSTRTAAGAALCGHCARPKRPCAGCGRVDHIKAVVDGDSLCQRCHQRPARACGRCGDLRRVAARHQNGDTDLCHRCYRTRQTTCALCHRERPQHTTTWPLGPVCTPCYRQVLRHPSTCPSCEQIKALIGLSGSGERVCGPCAGTARDYLCSTCGAAGEQHFAQTCLRCSVARATEQLLGGPTGAIPERLTDLPSALADRGRADSTMRWLLRPLPNALMNALRADKVITHDSLDACPPGQARHHLRGLLVDAGVLPVRDEHAERLATWVDDLIATLPPHHATVIVPYAHWRILRAVRRRTRHHPTSVGVAGSARERVRTAARLLGHLDQKSMDLGALTQDTLDRWTNGDRPRSSDIAPFISWLNRTGVTRGLTVETPRMAEPSEINDEDVHRTLVRGLITGTATTDLATRVAGLLVLLYGARIERIHKLTTADVTTEDGHTYLAVSAEPIQTPTPLGQLIGQLAADVESNDRALLRGGGGSYLFASPTRPHEPIHPTTLGRKLARAGIRPQITRNTAMLALTSDLPAAVVAVQTGLTAQTATRWARFSQRDHIEYIVARTIPASHAGRDRS